MCPVFTAVGFVGGADDLGRPHDNVDLIKYRQQRGQQDPRPMTQPNKSTASLPSSQQTRRSQPGWPLGHSQAQDDARDEEQALSFPPERTPYDDPMAGRIGRGRRTVRALSNRKSSRGRYSRNVAARPDPLPAAEAWSRVTDIERTPIPWAKNRHPGGPSMPGPGSVSGFVPRVLRASSVRRLWGLSVPGAPRAWVGGVRIW